MTACTIHTSDHTVTLHDGTEERVEIEACFDTAGNLVEPQDPGCAIIVAGPRANGNFVQITLDDERTLH